jgi:hypothetical protein
MVYRVRVKNKSEIESECEKLLWENYLCFFASIFNFIPQCHPSVNRRRDIAEDIGITCGDPDTSTRGKNQSGFEGECEDILPAPVKISVSLGLSLCARGACEEKAKVKYSYSNTHSKKTE